MLNYCCCLVTKSCPTLRLHGLQHIRLLCPPLSPGLCSNSCPLSHWCYLTISSSATPFSFCLQSFPASESFPMSWLLASGGASTSASVFPMNIQGWFILHMYSSHFLSKIMKDRKFVFCFSSFMPPSLQFSGFIFCVVFPKALALKLLLLCKLVIASRVTCVFKRSHT